MPGFEDLVRKAEAEAQEGSQEVEAIDDGEVDDDGRVRARTMVVASPPGIAT